MHSISLLINCKEVIHFKTNVELTLLICPVYRMFNVFLYLTINDAGGQQSGVAVTEPTGALLWRTRCWLRSLTLQRGYNICTIDVLQSNVEALHWEAKVPVFYHSTFLFKYLSHAQIRMPRHGNICTSQSFNRLVWILKGYSIDLLLALLPSLLAHRLSRAELWSSKEFGFSTRILLMSSTPNWSSRANSNGHN